MTARDAILRNKTDLQDILCGTPESTTRILEKAQAEGFITPREYNNLTQIDKANLEDKIRGLVDKITAKTEVTCKKFLDVLQTDADIIKLIPRLKEIQWGDYAGGPAHNRGQEDDQYKLTSKPTGLCVIFNNEIFPGSESLNRAGTNQDAVDLARTFSWLGFRVLMFKDQKRHEMEETLTLLSSLKNPNIELEMQWYQKAVLEWYKDEFTNFRVSVDNPLQHGDAFVCCLMSHGEKGGVFGTDLGLLSINDIAVTFNGVNCPLLNQKPKVFFIQACQSNSPGGAQADTSAGGDTEMVVTSEADFLVAMATVENYTAYRDEINGTPFVQSLCRQLKELCPSGADLMTILYRVNDDVAKKGEQMPGAKKLTLRKKLVFMPSK